MHFIHLFRSANSLWLFFCLYFLVRYRPTQAKRAVPVSTFSLERLSLLLTVPLIFFPRTHVFFLGARFHSSYAVAFAGLVLVTLGLAFAAWSRDLLGRNWSGQSSFRTITSWSPPDPMPTSGIRSIPAC